jgi:hypothetical protein
MSDKKISKNIVKTVKKNKLEKSVDIEDIIDDMSSSSSSEEEIIQKPIIKEKKPRTEKQIAAFNNAKLKLQEKNEIKKKEKETEDNKFKEYKKSLRG